jgi:GDP-L-fucose synthase
MKILITGGNGLVGRHLRETLQHPVSPRRHIYDLLNEEDVHRMLGKYKPEIVIHLAARVGGIVDNITNPVDYYEQNILMNTNVLKACHEHNVDRVIAMATSCSYPDTVGTYPLVEDNLFDGRPPHDNFSYAMSKRAMVSHIDAYVKQYNKKWCYLIPCNLYGEHDKYEAHHSHFISALIKKIHQAKDTIEIWGSGKPLRQFMHAEDLARVIEYMIKNDIVDNFNVAPNFNYTIEEMTKIGLKACGKEDLKIVYDDTKPDGQYRKDIDSSKLLSVLKGFEFTPLEEGIRRVYDNFSKRYN